MRDKVLVRALAVAGVAWAVAVAVGDAGLGGRAAGLPAGFPPDLPIPGDARVRTVRDLGARGCTVVVETGAGLAGAVGSFRGRMVAAGWTVVAEAAADGAVFTSYRKGERSVAVGASAAGGATQLGVAVVERPFNEWEGGQG